MSSDIRQRRTTSATITSTTAAPNVFIPNLPSPPTVTALKRLETISDLLSPSTSTFNFTSPPSTLFFLAIFALLLLPVRLLSAYYTPIQDCDETFNYWEPTHYLLHGYGLQTWEYSPTYALRSYLYVWLHVVAIWLADVSGVSGLLAEAKLAGEGGGRLRKIGEFYALRMVLATVCALCEARLCYAIAARFRRSIAVLTALLLAGSAGMFHASVAYVPSAFAMYCIMLCWSAWLLQEYALAIFSLGTAVLLGWPFAAVLGVPLALEVLWRYRTRLWQPLLYGAASAAAILIPSVLVDYHYYRKWCLAVLNIALYNSNTTTGGATLYGTAPASYYLLNLTLNFNLTLPLALLCPLVALLVYALYRSAVDAQLLLWTSPLFVWLAAMLIMPHKEERFLFVVYPLLCWCAAYTAVYLVLIARQFLCCAQAKRTRGGREEEHEEDEQLPTKVKTALMLSAPLGTYASLSLGFLAVAVALLSASRVVALIVHYNAPFDIYTTLAQRVTATSSNPFAASSPSTNPFAAADVCVGKEWYRFASHFFLPSASNHSVVHQLQFLPSSFTGLLPRHFPASIDESPLSALESAWRRRADGTRAVSPYQNDANREERERYVAIETCEWIVDLVVEGQKEQEYRHRRAVEREVDTVKGAECEVESVWRVVSRRRFVDGERSPRWSRAYWVPWLSEQRNVWGEYQLLERVQTRTCK